MKKPAKLDNAPEAYDAILGDISAVIDAARRSAARSANCIMTAAYWLIGRRIVECEQKGNKRAGYGEELLERLSADLGTRYGRGFGVDNLQRFRVFYLTYPPHQIHATLSRKFDESVHAEKYATLPRILCPEPQAIDKPLRSHAELNIDGLKDKKRKVSRKFDADTLAACFPLPWSAYVRLLSVKNEMARRFYETEALRGGWSVRQLDRQINAQFYERTALSRNKASMLQKGAKPLPEDTLLPEQEIKDPFVLEFLGLKDEYSESDLEEALIHSLETFLMELGSEFCFAGRQKRLRIGDEWHRVDLLFFHRRLRCLVVIDLKIGKFTHADAGQMHMYLNYAREHWVHEGENPPVGLILCARKDESVARYALGGLPNKIMAAEYRTALPGEKELAAEIERTQALLQDRRTLIAPRLAQGRRVLKAEPTATPRSQNADKQKNRSKRAGKK